MANSDLRLLNVFSQKNLVKMSATCSEDAQKSRNGAIMHKLSDVVHMDINVFGSLSLNWIIVDSNGTMIITIDNS